MKDLNVLVGNLCEDLTNELCMAYKHCKDNGAHYAPTYGKKYIKIVSYDNADKSGASVWGFININEFKKGLAGITFLEGDVLKASGWRAPALNRPRGNLFDGFYVDRRKIFGPGYISGYSAGGARNGRFV
ncbi:uncharacterized protein METZ01_LOCUS107094 [marine metagenome]|uniref:Uncharacterized protein n=1 Tax=marine metagenome TaxID=408172 RepID=A0A381WP42_9ZZZZ|tara:strand:+ start:165 stop:554 length:390 start_codon:yes stop_codon:yes gene_type:complete